MTIKKMAQCWSDAWDLFPINYYNAVGVIYIIYSLVIVIVNTLLIVSLIATKQSLKNSTNFLILCLSINDLAIGLISSPLNSLANLQHDLQKRAVLGTISMALQPVIGGCSVAMTLLLAIDRYLQMDPNFYRSPPRLAKFFKRPRIFIVVFGSWLAVVIESVAFYFVMQLGGKTSMGFFLCYAVFVSVMLILFMVMYARCYLRIRRFVADNPIYANRDETHSNETPEYLHELFKTVLLVLMTTCISWLPLLVEYYIVTISYLFAKQCLQSKAMAIYNAAALFLFYANSAANALIVIWRNTKSRKWIVKRFLSCFQKQNEVVALNSENSIGIISN